MTVTKFRQRKYVTKWGHEFHTKKELIAFEKGVSYAQMSVLSTMENIAEGLYYTRTIEER